MIILATLSVFIAVYCHAQDAHFWKFFWIAVGVWAVYSEAKRIAR